MSRVPIQQIARFTLKGRFSHNKSFGASVQALPPTLGRLVNYVKYQGSTNYCTAAARSAAGSYLWGQEMSFEYLTAKEGEEVGSPIYYGADPNLADKACEDYGFLPNALTPLSFQEGGWITPADWRNYNPQLDKSSVPFIVGAPFNIYPDYESIKQALFQGKEDNAVVIANGFWFDNWQDSSCYLPMPLSMVSRHSYLFIDWTEVNGTEYLIAQLSQGKDFGNDGVLYMSKEVVNAAFKSPALNGLGCTIFRKGQTTLVQTQINMLTKLVMLLGELRDILMGR